jgi:outer membrane protein assembly factor BamB
MRRWDRWLFLALLGSAVAPVLAAETLDVRALPTVVKVWEKTPGAGHLVVRKDTLYVRGGGQLAAIAIASGQTLWSRTLGEGCCTDDFLVTDRTVITSSDGSLFLWNARDGAARGRLDLGPFFDEGITAFSGPPIVALLPNTGELFAVDADSAEVTGRLSLEGDMMDLAVEDGIAVVNRVTIGEGVGTTAGYKADSLEPLWRITTPGLVSQLEWIGGRVFLVRYLGMGKGNELLPLDPATGRLGRPLPARRGRALGPGWPWEIQSLPGAGETGELRRDDPETGKAVWTTELPCQVEGVARDKGTLYASCSRGGGRELLVVLSWASGEVRQLAYGLPRGQAFFLAGKLLVVGSDDAVAAFSTTELGPPEAGLSVEAEVRRILLDSRGDDVPLARGQPIEDRARELETLGPAALPVIAALLPKLGPTSLVAAARRLAAGGYRAAAPALAAQFARPLEEPPSHPGYPGWNPQFALLRALAQLGGDREVPAVRALLENRERPGRLRREALATLVALRSPLAEQAVRAFLSPPPAPPQAAWNPPPPPADAADAAGGAGAGGGAGAMAVDLPTGDRLLLFRHGYLGSPDDLWAGRSRGSSRFTGLRLPAPEILPAPRARWAGGRIEVLDGAGRGIATFAPAEIARDGDGDGLPDLVERRLGLDPERADGDGDGLPDAADPTPNARSPKPADADQEIAAALFAQLFRFEEQEGEIAVVVSPVALEWRGRRDLTITLDEREAERFLAETGGGGVPLVRFQRGETAVVTLTASDPPGDPAAPAGDEEVYTVTVEHGRRSPTVIYRVVLRNLNARQPAAPRLWAIRSWRPISVL